MASTTLHLGNLPYDISETELEDIIKAHGEVDRIKKPYGKAYAFVTMKSEADMTAAIEKLNNSQIKGTTVTAAVSTGFRDPNDKETCFKCKQSGHWARDCPEGPYERRRAYRSPPRGRGRRDDYSPDRRRRRDDYSPDRRRDDYSPDRRRRDDYGDSRRRRDYDHDNRRRGERDNYYRRDDSRSRYMDDSKRDEKRSGDDDERRESRRQEDRDDERDDRKGSPDPKRRKIEETSDY